MAATIRLSQQHSCSFDHLVGDCEQARRNGEVVNPRCLHVNYELKLGGLLDRQILLALENATDIDADSAPYVREVHAIGHEPANFCVLAYRKNCWNGKSSCPRCKLNTAAGKECIGADEHRADPLMHNVDESRVDIAAAPGREYFDLQP